MPTPSSTASVRRSASRAHTSSDSSGLHTNPACTNRRPIASHPDTRPHSSSACTPSSADLTPSPTIPDLAISLAASSLVLLLAATPEALLVWGAASPETKPDENPLLPSQQTNLCPVRAPTGLRGKPKLIFFSLHTLLLCASHPLPLSQSYWLSLCGRGGSWPATLPCDLTGQSSR